MYVTTSSSLPSTIDRWVLTPRSINYINKVTCSSCNAIAIGDTLYTYELIRTQLPTNRFMSPAASESALSYNPWVRNHLTIVAKDRSVHLTMLYWSQIFSNLQLSWFAIYGMESIPCHLGYINRKSHSPQIHKVWLKCGLIWISLFGWQV